MNIYILLDVLLCSIAEHFYELCRILTKPVGRVKIQTKYKQNFSCCPKNLSCPNFGVGGGAAAHTPMVACNWGLNFELLSKESQF